MTNKFRTDSTDVTVCIPTLNEEKSISSVVESVLENGYRPLVIDGGSTDSTVSEAEQSGAVVVEQRYDGGKGAAVLEVMDNIESDILVLIDGDCTYEPDHIDDLLDPIRNDGADHVMGNRFNNMDEDAMSLSHRFGNRCANICFRVIIGRYLKDILTGFRALRMDSFNPSDLTSFEFEIETELCAYSVYNDHDIRLVGTNYYKRLGESKLGEIGDTLKILRRMVECRFESE